MKTLVKTNLSIGAIKTYKFGDNLEYGIAMHNNPVFEKVYNNVYEFLSEFYPNSPSDNLINIIKERFNNNGEVTYKPLNYKSNQIFKFKQL